VYTFCFVVARDVPFRWLGSVGTPPPRGGTTA
jgi:hypothetical protein